MGKEAFSFNVLARDPSPFHRDEIQRLIAEADAKTGRRLKINGMKINDAETYRRCAGEAGEELHLGGKNSPEVRPEAGEVFQ